MRRAVEIPIAEALRSLQRIFQTECMFGVVAYAVSAMFAGPCQLISLVIFL